jgi:hypothetical protein
LRPCCVRWRCRLRFDPEGSALTRLETRVALADHEDLAAPTHDLAVAMARLGRLKRGQDFHGLILRAGLQRRGTIQGNLSFGNTLSTNTETYPWLSRATPSCPKFLQKRHQLGALPRTERAQQGHEALHELRQLRDDRLRLTALDTANRLIER